MGINETFEKCMNYCKKPFEVCAGACGVAAKKANETKTELSLDGGVPTIKTTNFKIGLILVGLFLLITFYLIFYSPFRLFSGF